MSSFFRRGSGAGPPSYPSIGIATLLDLFEYDHGAIVGLLAAAIASIDTDVAQIERSVPGDDRAAILEAAHRIKGTSGSIGAARLIAISTAIEAQVNHAREPLPGAVLRELRAAVAAAHADIAAFAALSAPEP